ncbi:hypothetical protein ACWGVR_14535 [Streptomyces xanthophaeus]
MTEGSHQGVRLRECHNCARYTHTQYSRCEDCRRKRREPDRKHRRAISKAIFPADLRKQLLDQLRKGRPLGEACLILRIPAAQPHAFARIDPWFRKAFDEALMKGRNPDLRHGTEAAYRLHGCRCPECRQGKAARR